MLFKLLEEIDFSNSPEKIDGCTKNPDKANLKRPPAAVKLYPPLPILPAAG